MSYARKMLVIGLTGPTGAGKGTVAAVCAQYGIPSVDTDQVYHGLLVPPSPCLNELVERFGAPILSADGTLNRRTLAKRVFDEGTETDHRDLNRITHRYVLEKTRDLCTAYAADGVPAVLVDAPLLYESGFNRECDRVMAVLADRRTRLARIIARDGLPAEAALSRLNAQKADEFYTSRADAVIHNDGTMNDLLLPVHQILTEWGIAVP